MSVLKPVTILLKPNPGQSVRHCGQEIMLTEGGQLSVNGRVDARCAEFQRRSTIGSFNCFAVLRDSCIEIYEGASTGAWMLTRDAVLAVVGR